MHSAAGQVFDGEPAFESNGLRFLIEGGRAHHRGQDSKICGRECAAKIFKASEARMGSSQKGSRWGHFSWTHPECLSASQITNVRATYFPGEAAMKESYEKIPGWNVLSGLQLETTMEVFSKAINDDIGAVAAEKRAADAADEKERLARDQKERHAVLVEDRDLIALCSTGSDVLDKETNEYLKENLRFLGQSVVGNNKKQLCERIRTEVAARIAADTAAASSAGGGAAGTGTTGSSSTAPASDSGDCAGGSHEPASGGGGGAGGGK